MFSMNNEACAKCEAKLLQNNIRDAISRRFPKISRRTSVLDATHPCRRCGTFLRTLVRQAKYGIDHKKETKEIQMGKLSVAEQNIIAKMLHASTAKETTESFLVFWTKVMTGKNEHFENIDLSEISSMLTPLVVVARRSSVLAEVDYNVFRKFIQALSFAKRNVLKHLDTVAMKMEVLGSQVKRDTAENFNVLAEIVEQMEELADVYGAIKTEAETLEKLVFSNIECFENNDSHLVQLNCLRNIHEQVEQIAGNSFVMEQIVQRIYKSGKYQGILREINENIADKEAMQIKVIVDTIVSDILANRSAQTNAEPEIPEEEKRELAEVMQPHAIDLSDQAEVDPLDIIEMIPRIYETMDETTVDLLETYLGYIMRHLREFLEERNIHSLYILQDVLRDNQFEEKVREMTMDPNRIIIKANQVATILEKYLEGDRKTVVFREEQNVQTEPIQQLNEAINALEDVTPGSMLQFVEIAKKILAEPSKYFMEANNTELFFLFDLVRDENKLRQYAEIAGENDELHDLLGRLAKKLGDYVENAEFPEQIDIEKMPREELVTRLQKEISDIHEIVNQQNIMKHPEF